MGHLLAGPTDSTETGNRSLTGTERPKARESAVFLPGLAVKDYGRAQHPNCPGDALALNALNP